MKAGTDLVREGDIAEELFVLLSGRADVLRRDRRGVEYDIGDVRPGELLVKTLVLLCGYALLLSALPWVRATWPGTSTTYVSIPPMPTSITRPMLRAKARARTGTAVRSSPCRLDPSRSSHSQRSSRP